MENSLGTEAGTSFLPPGSSPKSSDNAILPSFIDFFFEMCDDMAQCRLLETKHEVVVRFSLCAASFARLCKLRRVSIDSMFFDPRTQI